ncbi:unnamed protein product [Ectocarpus sp. CCAP 1310/34]|nr:unnamed protein product [Ectocarpus sp. CCAP 1310/34]
MVDGVSMKMALLLTLNQLLFLRTFLKTWSLLIHNILVSVQPGPFEATAVTFQGEAGVLHHQ